MAMKKGLGKGLDALLGQYEEANSNVNEVDIYLIDTNAAQPRKTFDEDKLKELAQSVKRHGILQPIVVRKQGERYVIVMGERRYRAARLCGLEKVPVVIRTLEDAQAMEAALVENLQREDLNPVEEALGIQALMAHEDLTQEETAERLSKSRPAVANALRLLHLPEAVQTQLREGVIQAGHARALLGLKDAAAQASVSQRVARDGLSVRQTEALVKSLLEAKPAQKKTRKEKDNDLTAAEKALRDRLGTKVCFQGDANKGKIVIEYYSPAELQSIYERIIG